MMKYVRHRTLGFAIFPGPIWHCDAARSLGWARSDILSAGFVAPSPDGQGLRCRGESLSLDAKAAEDDSASLAIQIAD